MYPAELPFAPRPITGELLSSWARRLAAANHAALRDIGECLGARLHNPKQAFIFDYNAPKEWRFAFAHLTRVPARWVWVLDLQQHLPFARADDFLRQHGRPEIIEFGYCPECFADQLSNRKLLHVKAAWALATTTRCFEHELPLFRDCFHCGASDPIGFTPTSVECIHCRQSLSRAPRNTRPTRREPILSSFENAVAQAWGGTLPTERWDCGVTAFAFVAFIRDLLWLFTSKELSHPRLKQLMVDRIPLGRFSPREQYSNDLDRPFFRRSFGEREAVIAGMIHIVLGGEAANRSGASASGQE
jgi:hypothetical protein